MAEIQGSFAMRDYRKGNWTVGETMILIEAKKMDEERRVMKRSGTTTSSASPHHDHGDQTTPRSLIKPAELRWKWVEDYCWKKGCLRSQNQCNDKWDNLMRDYKKVREYERRIISSSTSEGKEGQVSYWKLEKGERKERNLPTNMVPQIYEALVEVVDKRTEIMGSSRVVVAASVSGSISPNNPNLGYVIERPMIHQSKLISSSPMMQQHLIQPQPIQAVQLLPAPLSAAQSLPPLPYSQPLNPPTCEDQSDTDTSEHSDSSPAKRRRGGSRSRGATSGGDQPQGISATSSEVGSAISRGASIIAEALHGCEERQERRHREILGIHERRIQIEETKTEINRQGISGLVDAINKLANSIHALASSTNQTQQQSSAPK